MILIILNQKFQSTLPREERPYRSICDIRRLGFQSTLPREERQYLTSRAHQLMDFNPRSHERSDGMVQSDNFPAYDISIHAPTRGATILAFWGMCCDVNFNPRSHERSDELPQLGNSNSQFQSTLPREERPSFSTSTAFLCYFNPRSHERSDSNIAQKICLFLYNTDNKYIIR